jgi:hypothetical protein
MRTRDHQLVRGRGGARQRRNDRSLILDERVGQPDFDECLPGHAETPGLLIDLAQEVYREVYIHALDSADGTDGFVAVHVRRQVNSSVMHGVELGGRQCPNIGGTLLLHCVLV